MTLSDFGSIASIISLIVGLITGFLGCKISIKNSKEENSIKFFGIQLFSKSKQKIEK